LLLSFYSLHLISSLRSLRALREFFMLFIRARFRNLSRGDRRESRREVPVGFCFGASGAENISHGIARRPRKENQPRRSRRTRRLGTFFIRSNCARKNNHTALRCQSSQTEVSPCSPKGGSVVNLDFVKFCAPISLGTASCTANKISCFFPMPA